MQDLYGPLDLASNGIPVSVTFARPTALKGTLGLTLVATRPTIFFGVPRVWEKFMAKIKAAAGAKAKAAIGQLAKAKGLPIEKAQALVMAKMAAQTPEEKRAAIAPMVGLDKAKVCRNEPPASPICPSLTVPKIPPCIGDVHRRRAYSARHVEILDCKFSFSNYDTPHSPPR